jgi:TPR repeat protein
MQQNQNVFQKSLPLFLEHLIPETAKSSEYSRLEDDLEALLLLADRILSSCQENLEFSRVLNIAELLTKLNKEEKPSKAAENLLEDIELWLKVILSYAKPTLWETKRNDNRYTLVPLIRDLDLLAQSEISLSIDSFYQISDSATQLIFLAYRYRNPLTHSPRNYPDHIKARFMPASLCILIAPIYKYKKQLREALNGFIACSFSSTKHLDLLSLINSERQKHLMNFRGRENWLQQLVQKLTSSSEKPKPYVLLNGYEGMGKSALVAKITEELSSNTHTIGRNAGLVRKNAPWLPNAIVHFGKQSNQPHEIVDLLLAQINTLLLEPIDIEQVRMSLDDYMHKELSRYRYFPAERPGFESLKTSESLNIDEKAYSLAQSQDSIIDPFRTEGFDFTLYRRVLYLGLERVVKEKGAVILIIDAIDEISSDGNNLNFLPDLLPVGVSALLTARESRVIKWLENSRDVETIRIKEIEKKEIPLFTNVRDEDGEMQARFNERVWKASNGWPLMVLEASKLVQNNPSNLDQIQIDRSKDSFFERRVSEWRSPVLIQYQGLLIEVLIILSIFEPVNSLDLDMIQSFLERKSSKFSRDEIKQMLQVVSSQIEGLDANRIKLALKAFAEYIRERWLGKRDLLRWLEDIIQWLTTFEFHDAELLAQFLNYWGSPYQTKDVRTVSEKLLDNLILNKESDVLHKVYLGLRKHSKKASVLSDLMLRSLESAAELGSIVAMRILGSRLIDGAGIAKDKEKGLFWLEKAAIGNDTQAKISLANRLLDGRGIPQNIEKGKEWLSKAVDSEDNRARLIYATRLIEGNGLLQDIYQGEILLRELAESGYEQAIFSLIYRLMEGDGIEQDIELCERMLREFSDKNDLAALLLADRLIDGNKLKINSVEGESILRRLASKGDRLAIMTLANRLFYGRGLPENVDESLMLLTNLANSGDFPAMRILGDIFIKGDKVTADPEIGKKWLIKAAEGDDSQSIVKLAIYLLEGKGLNKNSNEGKKLLYKAAESQAPRAMQILGVRLIDGAGISKDQKQGLKWLQKAIDANDPIAMLSLGKRMLYGNGVAKDVVKGEELIRNAIANGSTEAVRTLGNELLKGIALVKSVDEGEKLLRKAAENGQVNAIVDLGMRLFDGDGIQQNTQEAQLWLTKAMKNGNARAKVFFGSRLLEGKFIEKDIERGEMLLREAIADGDQKAKRALGKLLIDTSETGERFLEGIKLIREAADSGDQNSIFALADMLFEGDKVSKNEKEAKQLLKRLVQLDNPKGMGELGNRYLIGNGVKKDIREGLKLLYRSLEKGEGNAGAALGRYYYEAGNLEKSTMYLIKGTELGSDTARNNLSFLIRRGETLGDTDKYTIDKLLLELVNKKELFAMINYALCFAQGLPYQKDWHKADEIFSSLSEADRPAKTALSWWHETLIRKNSDPEGHLVVGWLVRYQFIEDPDNLTVAQRMAKVRDGGWDVPDWMDKIVSK